MHLKFKRTEFASWYIFLISAVPLEVTFQSPVDKFGTVVGENPTPYGILALWAVNGLSIVYVDLLSKNCPSDFSNVEY